MPAAHGGDRLGQHVPRAVDLHPALGLRLRRRRVLLLLLLAAGRAPAGLLRRRLAVRVVPALVVSALAAGRRRAPAGLGSALPLRGRRGNPTARAAAPGSAAARAAGRRGPGAPGPRTLRALGTALVRGRLAVGVVALGLALHLRHGHHSCQRLTLDPEHPRVEIGRARELHLDRSDEHIALFRTVLADEFGEFGAQGAGVGRQPLVVHAAQLDREVVGHHGPTLADYGRPVVALALQRGRDLDRLDLGLECLGEGAVDQPFDASLEPL